MTDKEPTPHEKAIMLFDSFPGYEGMTDEQMEALDTMEAFTVFDEEKKWADAWIKIRSDGFIHLGNNGQDNEIGFSPEEFEKICKWYLGL